MSGRLGLSSWPDGGRLSGHRRLSLRAASITEAQVLTLIPATVLDRPGVGGEPLPSPSTTVPTGNRPPPSDLNPRPPRRHPRRPAAPAAPPKTVATTPPRQPRRTRPVKDPAPPQPRQGASESKRTFTPAHLSTRPPSRNTDFRGPRRGPRRRKPTTNECCRKSPPLLRRWLPASKAKLPRSAWRALPGEGGGEAFVNYRTAVFNAYYQAWKTPEDTTQKLTVRRCQNCGGARRRVPVLRIRHQVGRSGG